MGPTDAAGDGLLDAEGVEEEGEELRLPVRRRDLEADARDAVCHPCPLPDLKSLAG